MLNTKAILFYKQEFYKRAISYLKKAAELAIDLPPEMSILTLVNISICLEQSDPEESKKYQEVASRLKNEYNFDFPLN
jgi:tetratricopeptide (TPR) repeat protein